MALFAVVATGCSNETERLAAALPSCERACAGNPRLSNVLELSSDGVRLWRDGASSGLEGDQAIAAWDEGDPTSRHVPILCQRDVPGTQLQQLLARDLLAKRGAVSLAGFDGTKIGFATFRLFDGPSPASGAAARGAIDVAKADAESLANGSLTSVAGCAAGSEGPCPIVVVHTSEYTCAEIVETADKLVSHNLLLGLRREVSSERR